MNHEIKGNKKIVGYLEVGEKFLFDKKEYMKTDIDEIVKRTKGSLIYRAIMCLCVENTGQTQYFDSGTEVDAIAKEIKYIDLRVGNFYMLGNKIYQKLDSCQLDLDIETSLIIEKPEDSKKVIELKQLENIYFEF